MSVVRQKKKGRRAIHRFMRPTLSVAFVGAENDEGAVAAADMEPAVGVEGEAFGEAADGAEGSHRFLFHATEQSAAVIANSGCRRENTPQSAIR
jgi:hypothetical protein